MTVPAEPKSKYSNNQGATQDVMDDLNDLPDKKANAADVSKEFHGDRTNHEAEEERRYQNHTTHPGKQGQNQ
jgi:hypothetical protein